MLIGLSFLLSVTLHIGVRSADMNVLDAFPGDATGGTISTEQDSTTQEKNEKDSATKSYEQMIEDIFENKIETAIMNDTKDKSLRTIHERKIPVQRNLVINTTELKDKTEDTETEEIMTTKQIRTPTTPVPTTIPDSPPSPTPTTQGPDILPTTNSSYTTTTNTTTTAPPPTSNALVGGSIGCVVVIVSLVVVIVLLVKRNNNTLPKLDGQDSKRKPKMVQV
eukprot:GFUD01034554.1.p1 GENE.GFUD01034554.1~~GFUD01034554.1.p1  ORF type:complete len:222 (+),score=84.02 GFUD01034554.1:109-774(+)